MCVWILNMSNRVLKATQWNSCCTNFTGGVQGLNRPHVDTLSCSKCSDPSLVCRKSSAYTQQPWHSLLPSHLTGSTTLRARWLPVARVFNEPHETGQMSTARCHWILQTWTAWARLVTQVQGLCPSGNTCISVQNCPFHGLWDAAKTGCALCLTKPHFSETPLPQLLLQKQRVTCNFPSIFSQSRSLWGTTWWNHS